MRTDVAKGAGGMVGCCAPGNEPSGFIKCVEFRGYSRNC